MDRDADRVPGVVRAGTAIYRAALHLFPYGFRHTYGDELGADFHASSAEAFEAGGVSALARWWARAALDLLISLPAEWVRTPWIPVLAAAAAIAVTIFVGIWARGKRAFASLPIDRPPESPELIALLVLALLVPIVGTIAIWSMVRLMQYVSDKRRLAPGERSESTGV